MTPQMARVLALLTRDGARSCDSMATELDFPAASVRRTVTQLIRDGFRIIRPDGTPHGEYRLL